MGMENSSQGNLQFFTLWKTDTAFASYTPNYLNFYIGYLCVIHQFCCMHHTTMHFHTQFHRKCPLKLRYCLTGTLPFCACILCAQDRTLKTNSDTRGHDQLNFLYVHMEICISTFGCISHAQPKGNKRLVNFMTNHYYGTHN